MLLRLFYFYIYDHFSRNKSDIPFFCSRSQRYDSAVTAASVPIVVPLGDKDAIMNSIADSYLANNELTKHKKYHKNKKFYKKIRKCQNILKVIQYIHQNTQFFLTMVFYTCYTLDTFEIVK